MGAVTAQTETRQPGVVTYQGKVRQFVAIYEARETEPVSGSLTLGRGETARGGCLPSIAKATSQPSDAIGI